MRLFSLTIILFFIFFNFSTFGQPGAINPNVWRALGRGVSYVSAGYFVKEVYEQRGSISRWADQISIKKDGQSCSSRRSEDRNREILKDQLQILNGTNTSPTQLVNRSRKPCGTDVMEDIEPTKLAMGHLYDMWNSAINGLGRILSLEPHLNTAKIEVEFKNAAGVGMGQEVSSKGTKQKNFAVREFPVGGSAVKMKIFFVDGNVPSEEELQKMEEEIKKNSDLKALSGSGLPPLVKKAKITIQAKKHGVGQQFETNASFIYENGIETSKSVELEQFLGSGVDFPGVAMKGQAGPYAKSKGEGSFGGVVRAQGKIGGFGLEAKGKISWGVRQLTPDEMKAKSERHFLPGGEDYEETLRDTLCGLF